MKHNFRLTSKPGDSSEADLARNTVLFPALICLGLATFKSILINLIMYFEFCNRKSGLSFGSYQKMDGMEDE